MKCSYCSNPVNKKGPYYGWKSGKASHVKCYESNPRTWSPEQKVVIEDVKSGKGNTVVQARAGTGKTSTIVESLKTLPPNKSILLAAFNVKIKNDLLEKQKQGEIRPDVWIKTLNAVGNMCIKNQYGNRANLVDDAISQSIDLIWGRKTLDDKLWGSFGALRRLLDIAKGTLAHHRSDLEMLCDKYQIVPGKNIELKEFIDIADRLLHETAVAINHSNCCDSSRPSVFRNVSVRPYDFADQVWLTITQNLPVPQFDYVFIDETQDLNLAQIELVLKMCGENGRIVAIGDDRQAIYRFRGSDEFAVDRVIKELKAKVLPLTVSFRCSKAVIKEAQQYVPDIQPWEHAKEGKVERVNRAKFLTIIQPMNPPSFVLSRTNAPLAGICLDLIRKRKPARIAGRKDILPVLLNLINKSKAHTVVDLIEWLEEYKYAERTRLSKRKNVEKIIEQMEDEVDTVLEFTQGMGPLISKSGGNEIDALKREIEGVFIDEEKEKPRENYILCSTVHKAKGLESAQVGMLLETFKPGGDIEEKNITYVAITRSQDELYYVTETNPRYRTNWERVMTELEWEVNGW